MKFLCFTVSICLISFIYPATLSAQNQDTATAIKAEDIPQYGEVGVAPVSPPSEEDIHLKVDEQAQYKGDLSQFFAQNLNFPYEAVKAGISGRVVVEFVIDETGKVTQVQTRGRTIGYGLEEEAVRVVQSLKNFSPGKIKGKPVKTKMRLPIVFQLTE